MDEIVEYERGQRYVAGTSCTLYQAIECVVHGMPEDVVDVLGLRPQQAHNILTYIENNRTILYQEYQNEIASFTSELLQRMHGVHQPSRQQRVLAIAFIPISIIVLIFGVRTWWSNDISLALFLCLAGSGFFLASIFLTFAQFKRRYIFHDDHLTVVEARPTMSFSIAYRDIVRISVEYGTHGLRYLVVRIRDGTAQDVYCTDSMKSVIDDMLGSETYDPYIHWCRA